MLMIATLARCAAMLILRDMPRVLARHALTARRCCALLLCYALHCLRCCLRHAAAGYCCRKLTTPLHIVYAIISSLLLMRHVIIISLIDTDYCRFTPFRRIRYAFAIIITLRCRFSITTAFSTPPSPPLLIRLPPAYTMAPFIFMLIDGCCALIALCVIMPLRAIGERLFTRYWLRDSAICHTPMSCHYLPCYATLFTLDVALRRFITVSLLRH